MLNHRGHFLNFLLHSLTTGDSGVFYTYSGHSTHGNNPNWYITKPCTSLAGHIYLSLPDHRTPHCRDIALNLCICCWSNNVLMYCKVCTQKIENFINIVELSEINLWHGLHLFDHSLSRFYRDLVDERRLFKTRCHCRSTISFLLQCKWEPSRIEGNFSLKSKKEKEESMTLMTWWHKVIKWQLISDLHVGALNPLLTQGLHSYLWSLIRLTSYFSCLANHHHSVHTETLPLRSKPNTARLYLSPVVYFYITNVTSQCISALLVRCAIIITGISWPGVLLVVNMDWISTSYGFISPCFRFRLHEGETLPLRLRAGHWFTDAWRCRVRSQKNGFNCW